MDEAKDLYRVHRPKDFDSVHGQDVQVRFLKGKLANNDFPQVLLLSGPTGVGKTTLAHILARKLECTNPIEVNCADVRGIDSAREIDSAMRYKPMTGKSQVWILDEVVQLPKATQQAFLKILEECPGWTHFILCTSEISGLLPTFMGRCLHLQLQALETRDLVNIVNEVLQVRKEKLDATVVKAIAVAASGSGRMALQLLSVVLATERTVEGALEAIGTSRMAKADEQEFLPRALLARDWTKIVVALATIEEKDVEGIRRQTLAYMSKVLLSSRNPRAFQILQSFKFSFSESGRPGLAAACYEAIQ